MWMRAYTAGSIFDSALRDTVIQFAAHEHNSFTISYQIPLYPVDRAGPFGFFYDLRRSKGMSAHDNPIDECVPTSNTTPEAICASSRRRRSALLRVRARPFLNASMRTCHATRRHRSHDDAP